MRYGWTPAWCTLAASVIPAVAGTSSQAHALPCRGVPHRIASLVDVHPPELGTPGDPTAHHWGYEIVAVGQPGGHGPFVNNLWVPGGVQSRWAKGGQRTACASGGFNFGWSEEITLDVL